MTTSKQGNSQHFHYSLKNWIMKGTFVRFCEVCYSKKTITKKLELVVGSTADKMQLELRDKDGKFVSSVTDGDLSLEKLGVSDGMLLNVIDTSGGFMPNADDAMVDKYEISDDSYDKRADSVRAWKQREGFGRFNADAQKQREQKEKQIVDESKQIAAKFQVGQRCVARLSHQPEKRGTIAFIGETHFKPGVWIGVRYDEPLGKNNGSVDGHKYFECAENYGGFVRPQDMTVGDYPEQSVDDEMDEILN